MHLLFILLFVVFLITYVFEVTIVQSSMIDLYLMLEIRKSFQLGLVVAEYQFKTFLITILKNMKITEDSQ